MSLAVIPLVITGQITGVSNNGNATLYRMTFKNIDGDPLYGVTAVWTDEQAEIAALAAQKPYGVWINPIDGTFTVKFAGYTYVGSADLTDSDVLAGITPIEFTSAEVSDRLLPEVDAEDAGKTVIVNEDGKWELGEAGSGSDAIIINAIAGEAGANFNSQFSDAISPITSATMRSHSQSKGIASETGQAILETLAQDPTKSKDAYLFYLYGNHAHVVKCSQVYANQAKNMGGQYDTGDRIDFLFEGTVFQPAIADLPTPIVKFVVDIYRVAMEGRFIYNCIVYGYGI